MSPFVLFNKFPAKKKTKKYTYPLKQTPFCKDTTN